mgnify:FL=1
MTLSAIVACDANGLIGLDGALPWRLPEEMRHFRALTLGHAVIMGRRTWDSLPCPLSGRFSIVVTSRPFAGAEGVCCVPSLDDALDFTGSEEAFVIGGARLFSAALPRCDRLYLTCVQATIAVPAGAVATYLPGSGWRGAQGVEVARSVSDPLRWVAYRIDRVNAGGTGGVERS